MSFNGFPPFISAQLQYLLTNSPHFVKVEQVWSGSKYSPGSYDRFTLLIPYCLDYIRWDFLYNSEFPLAPPDVVFGPGDENFSPFLLFGAGGGGGGDLNNIFADWNYKDPTRLLALVEELREKYTLYQQKRVGELDDDRLKFEISTILSREGIEMQMSSGVDKHSQRRSNLQCLYWT